MRRILAILVVAVLLGSCSGASDSATAPPPATTQAAATGQIDGSFDVGGYSLHLRCQGTGSPGSPTAVYLHGLGGDGSNITSINTPLASQVRVCTYDRVNVGRSDQVTGRHTGADSVRDLHTLLDAPGPYLWSGLLRGLLAIMHPHLPTRSWGWSAWTGACPPTTRSISSSPRMSRSRSWPSRNAIRSRWTSTAPRTRPRRWWPRSRTCR